MKKILYTTSLSRVINAFLVPHIEMLIKECNYKVDIACCVDRKIDPKLIDLGVKIYDIPFSRSPLAFSNLKAFKKLIKIQNENCYDIIHVHTPVASIFGRLLKIKFKKLKTIYTAHGYHFFKGSSKIGWILYYPIEKIMAKLTDVTININKEDYEITKNKLKPKQSYLIKGVGIDLNKYKSIPNELKRNKRESLGIEKNDFLIIMIAELNKNKNQIQLIKAMELLKDNYPEIKAILVGEGDSKLELEKEIKERSLEKNIKLLGLRKDVNELINISDLGTLLSYREGLPRSIMEMIANQKKVIGTNIRGIRDLIINEKIGSLVEVGDYELTKDLIEKYYKERFLAQDKKEQKKMAKRLDINEVNNQIKKIMCE